MITLPETPFTQNGITFTSFRITSLVTDSRPNKDYRRNIGVHVAFRQLVDTTSLTPFVQLQERLLEAFQRVEKRYAYVAGGWGNHSISVIFDFHAKKPSLILTEEAAWEQLPWTSEEVARTIVEVCSATHDEWKEEQALDKRLRVANHLRGWVVKTFNERAKKNVFYDERLQKLEEEYALAAEAAFRAGRDAVQKQILEEHPEFDPRSVRAAFDAAATLVGKHEGPFASTPASLPKDAVR